MKFLASLIAIISLLVLCLYIVGVLPSVAKELSCMGLIFVSGMRIAMLPAEWKK